MNVYTYDPTKVILNIGGYVISGVKSVSVTPNAPAFKVVKGIRGVNTRVFNRDTSAEMTITLLQTSISNDVLSAIIFADKTYRTGRLEISLTDAGGTTLIASDEGFVEELPAVQFGRELSDRTWKICMLSTRNALVGGNSKPNGNIF